MARTGQGELRTSELRRQIKEEIDPLRKIMRLAQGRRIRGMRRRPLETEIIEANYKLLAKYLPDVKSVDAPPEHAVQPPMQQDLGKLTPDELELFETLTEKVTVVNATHSAPTRQQ